MVRRGNVHTSQEGSTFSMTLGVGDTFGESALFGDDTVRLRGATITASEGGAAIIVWPVLEIENLIGYELHTESERMVRCRARLRLPPPQIPARKPPRALGHGVDAARRVAWRACIASSSIGRCSRR